MKRFLSSPTQRKRFFFEKKKQKTFIRCSCAEGHSGADGQAPSWAG
jgi:hypothetical protein